MMNTERFALYAAILGAVLMTALGGVFAFLTGSDAILLDALFNLITLVMSLLTLKVAKLIYQGDSERFQFGYYQFEPMLNMSKALIILGLCALAGTDAVMVILKGGKALNMGLAVLYASLATAICIVVALVLNRLKQKLHSPLVDLEAFNWLVNGLISAGVAATFVVAYFLENSDWSYIVPYVDPAIVLLLILLVIKFPFEIAISSSNQLLGAAPNAELQSRVKTEVEAVQVLNSLGKINTKMSLMGRLLYVKLEVIIPGGLSSLEPDYVERIHHVFEKPIQKLHPHVRLDVTFSAQSNP